MTNPLNENERLLVRIDERTARLNEKLDAINIELLKRIADHESRLRELENSIRWTGIRDLGAYLAAIAAAIVGAVTGKP